MSRDRPTIEVLSRSGCHLCDEAMAVLGPMARRRGVRVVVRDIDESPVLIAEFGTRVPVLRDVEGSVLAEGRIDKRAVRDALVAVRRGSGPPEPP